jgi:hypothetical protein
LFEKMVGLYGFCTGFSWCRPGELAMPMNVGGECVRRDARHGDRDGRGPRNMGFHTAWPVDKGRNGERSGIWVNHAVFLRRGGKDVRMENGQWPSWVLAVRRALRMPRHVLP